ncbi:MAG: integration host factor subunit alpha [Oceanobacter sp.]|jgi:integration host factor subunit alpha
MGALTKAELAEKLFEELDLNKREAKDMVDLFFEEIRDSLSRNEQVKLSGFGNFDLRDKRQRPGRNPKTGEEIPISARRVVTFKPGQKLKVRVEDCDELK